MAIINPHIEQFPYQKIHFNFLFQFFQMSIYAVLI